MKRTIAITFLSSILAMAATAAFAQGSSTATIPFNFRVGSALLPAGSYEIRHLEANVVTFRNLDGRGSAIALATTTTGDTAAVSKLVFNRYGERYFLNETVSMRGAGEMTFAPTRLEKSIQAEEAMLATEGRVLVATK